MRKPSAGTMASAAESNFCSGLIGTPFNMKKIFRNGYPREMFRELEELGAEITEERHGVYSISGPFPFPAQVIVCRQLDPGANAALRILAPNVLESDVKDFLAQADASVEPGFLENVQAVVSVSTLANHELFDKIRGNFTMSQVLLDLYSRANIAANHQTWMLAREYEFNAILPAMPAKYGYYTLRQKYLRCKYF